MASKPTGVRARARAQFIDDIKRAAKAQLRSVGAGSLSLRAVARELGVASSALYRYFPSRDELLTALITDAYNDVADAAEAAVASTAGRPFVERWLVLAQAIRGWALDRAHEFALIYGSPVPGYAAPPETAAPVQRLTLTLLRLLHEGPLDHRVGPAAFRAPPATSGAYDLVRSLAEEAFEAHGDDPVGLTDGVLRAGIGLWTQLFGHLGFELFGQFQNVVVDFDEFFEVQMVEAAERLAPGSATVGGPG